MADDVDDVAVSWGNPINDQMLAQTREDFRKLLDFTAHDLIDQAEEQGADMSMMMAALASGWMNRTDYMPRERLVSLLALASITIAQGEREPGPNGRTVRKQ